MLICYDDDPHHLHPTPSQPLPKPYRTTPHGDISLDHAIRTRSSASGSKTVSPTTCTTRGRAGVDPEVVPVDSSVLA